MSRERLINDTIISFLVLALSYIVYLWFLNYFAGRQFYLVYYDLVTIKRLIQSSFVVFLGLFSGFVVFVVLRWLITFQIIKPEKSPSNLLYLGVGAWLFLLGILWGPFLNPEAEDSALGSVYWVIYSLSSGRMKRVEDFIFSLILIAGMLFVGLGVKIFLKEGEDNEGQKKR